MKTNKILATVALAFAAAVAAPARGETLTGDIVDVRVVDIADMVFDNGVAHASGEPLCTPSNPLVAGHTMYIRVRMLVANHDAVRGDEYGTSVVPLGWSFQPTGIGSALLNTPKLGLWIGERAAYAEVVETGPFVWQREGPMENDDAGDTTPPKNTKYRYFSDLYFAYTVQPGDLGFPVKLMNSSGSGPASMDDETHGYYILNVSGYSPTWTLMNTESTVAKFWYGDIDTMEEDWPTGKYADDKALKNYDLSLSSAYVKTIDFDNNYVDAENGIWREVLPGMSAPPGDTPRLEVGGGSCPTQTVVYVWSADESVVVPVASGANTTNVVDGKIVLTVVVPKGAESVDFKLKGANDAATGTEALIYMSSEAAGNVSKPSGELVNVAVSRTIRIAPPRDPSVTLDLDGAPTKEVTADEDYVGAKARLALRVSPACDEPITVRLKASVSGDDTLADIDDLFDANIIRIAEGDYGGDPLDKKVKDVTIAAGEEVVYLNVYVLGGTSKTGNKGVNFSLERVVVPEKVKTDGNCTLKIKRSTPVILSSDPAFTVGDDIGTISTVSGSDVVFTLGISDSYRDFYDTSKGYTFRWSLVDEDVEDAEDITYDEDIDGFQGTAVFNNVTGDDGVDLSLYVVNPDGMVSKPVKYKLIVKESKQTTISFADPTDRLVFAEGEDAWLSLGVSQAYGSGNSYIFIDADDAATLNCITTELTSAGAQLVKGRTRVDSPRKISFTDGGKDATIKAVLSKKEKVKDPVTTYTSGTLSFTITNVPPELLLVSFAGQSVDPEVDYGKTIEPVACGVLKTFSLSATDVSQADIDAGIMAEWRIGAFVTNVVATNSFKYALQTPNTTQEVRIRLKDKDMATYPAKDSIRFKVPVVNNPHVTVESDDGVITFTETSGKIIDGKIIVSLSEIANAELNVRLKIAKAGDGGFARLETGNGVALVAEDDDYIEYDVTFNAYQQSRPLRILGMDGTPDTEGGLTVDAEVTTETTNADGVPWNEFYAKAEQVQLVVVNAPPEILRPSLSEVSVTNKNASINTPYPILYACRDVVTNDLIKGVTMEISVDGTTVLTTNVTDTAVRTNNIEFTTAGLHSVVVSALDKDGGYSVREWLFFVTPAKVLKLRAHGPASSTISISGDSVRYGSAGGLGAGRVFAGQQEVGPQQIRSFVHTYAFNEKESSADAWAFSYKASDGDDDGTLPAPDWPIDEDGDWSKDTNISKHYCYAITNFWGKKGYDSFFYAWACDNVEASSSSGSSSQTKKLYIAPETAGVVNYTSIPLPSGKKGENSSGDQSQGTEVIVHPEQIWEAVFSREYLLTDNCGDINNDGVPDLAVCNYGMDVFNLETSLPDFTTSKAGDLADLSGYNGDKDKDGNDAPDYLPSTETSIYGSLIPGLSGTWVTYGTEFNAKTEIRGYHEGLNDAMELLGFAVESDRIYAVTNAAGEWTWTEDCTISKLEWYAWREYALANGLEWTNKNHWVQWSPERPTSPILNDTDGDGFEDGYEYFFWYRAHVGYMDGGVYRRLTGRRYDPRNPGEGVFISSDDIATLMDPRVATDMASAKTRDTDNDALPDLLEFMIGTNPFDFDTDGDGLPDGWELMIAGLNPLLAVTAKDAMNDGTRNYDGDAMAITSFALEKLLDPAPAHPEICQFTTFAVIDPDGDSDGVQWYAATNTAECVSNLLEKVDLLEEEGSKLWTFTLADGSKKKVVSTMEPVVIDGGLAVSLSGDVAYLVEASEKEGEGDDAVDILTRGWPVRLPAGTKVSGVKALTSPNKVYMLKLTENIPNIAANAAWIYGRGSADATRGAVAKTAADYGCLALARPLAVPKDRIFCAPPKEDRDVALLHYLVYQQCGFDPRTAWCARDPLAARWGKTIDGEIVEGMESDSPSAKYVRHPARTREYRTYDEFLVYSFFKNNGCEMGTVPDGPYVTAPSYLAVTWGAFTTNPQGPDEPERIQLEPSSDAQSAVGWSQYFFGTESTNGADTDGDGVPDGWELYVMAGPKTKAGRFVFAPPFVGFRPATAAEDMEYSYFSPFLNYSHATETLNENYVGADADDEMNEFQEFEGTDSTAWYSAAQSTEATPYSTTIVHDGEWKWFNKFFPTDPWNKDTDGDGLEDNKEGESFAYGTPADDGALICIPGGGLNPCSVDTDFDGLPDPWEVQFKGKTQFPGSIPEPMAGWGNKAKDADGNDIGNYLQGLVDGMDGTALDAQNSPITFSEGTSTNVTGIVVWRGANQVVDRDYDHDGLEPWQEYFTGMMRCWRYDDPVSPWIPIPYEAYNSADVANYAVLEEWYEANAAMHPWIDELGGWMVRPLPGGDGSQEEIDDFWYATLVDRSSFLYNPGFVTDMGSCAQYLSFITNTWDIAYGGHYWFYDRVGDSKIENIWAYGGTKGAPKKYACCSPIDADSDLDGMDDYYELFHGMNPLLGASGVLKDTKLPCDLVFDSWGKSFAYNANHCYWTAGDDSSPGSDWDYCDFVRNPWLNGTIDADPDGDGFPNQTEAMLPKLASPQLHTDPTPLWMTDSSYEYSLVRMFYRMPYRFYDAADPAPALVYLAGAATDDDGNVIMEVVDGEEMPAYKETFRHEFATLAPPRRWKETYWYKDYEGYHEGVDPVNKQRYGWFGTYNPDFWSVVTDPAPDTFYWNWMFSFEENEGYDSDHDALSDEEEKTSRFRSATDPLYADSPRRRQAMYFQGPERPSALQTMPQDKEDYPVCAMTYQSDMTFRTFTVECWARPESTDDSVLVERAVWIGRESPGDEELMRKNFQLAIKEGKWYAKFDPFGTRADDAVEALSVTAATTNWTHLAATYDGNELVLYVNGVAEKRKRSELLPAYGSQGVAIHPDQSYMIDLEYLYHAIIVGASAKTRTEGGTGYALDVTLGMGWDYYTRFYKGWIDEVRVWDGARTADEISAAMNTRFDAAMAAENRQTFFEKWSTGVRRDEKTSAGKATEMPAELIYHWSFDSVPGAQNEDAVAKAPLGFHDARAVLSRPDGYVVGWWQDVLDGLPEGKVFSEGTSGYAGAVYDDKAWVPWIPSTVAHLPRFDGTTLDSFFWSKDFMGDAAGSYNFVNSAEPVSRWRQFTYNGALNAQYYWTTPERHFLVNAVDSSSGSNFRSYFEFTGRNRDNCGDDLIPLGGAYVRMTDNTVGLWDGQGASSNWEITGSDADGDGLPDWWERYADENYRPEGMDPSVKIGWDTIIERDGVKMIAGEAYLRDLAMGVHMGADGEISLDENGDYRQVSDEDGSGVPDWWEDLFDIRGELGIDDHDNDGLPNYVEYLLSEVFKFEVMFNPTVPNSVDANTPDYFFRVGSLYVGEIFTDHDLMEDAWEDDYPMLADGVTRYASRFAYDAAADADEDGWSNMSEVRYSNMAMPIQANVQTHYSVSDGLVADYPIPTLALTVRYNGGRQSAVSKAPLVVRVGRKYSGNRDPDAEYRIGEVSESGGGTGDDSGKETAELSSYTRVLGKWSDRHVRGTLTPGNVSLDSLAFQSCYDPSAMIYTWIVYHKIGRASTWGEEKRGLRSEYDLDRRKYGEANVELVSTETTYKDLIGLEKRTDETGATAVWTISATGARIGTVNLNTGEFDIDLGVFKGITIQDAGSTNENDKVAAEEQTYRIVYSSRPSVGLPRHLYLGIADAGYVREGLNDIEVFADIDGNGQYDVGEPYGVATDVDVTWKDVPVEIEMTEDSPVTQRFDLWDAGAMLMGNTNALIGTSWEYGEDADIPNSPVRVRVVRWKLDGIPRYEAAIAPEVVFDKILDPSVAKMFTEADFIGDGKFDIDWDNFYSGVVQNTAVQWGNYRVVSMDYLVVFGDGDVSFLNRADTNKLLTVSKQIITRRYGETRVLPVPVSPATVAPESSAYNVVSTANPTFAWTLDCPELEGYTAFRIQVTNESGVVYDSGIHRAPARDVNGVYRWKAPLYVDDMMTNGVVFANKSMYGWRVSMYNAKFKNDAFSPAASFLLHVQTNGYSCGTVKTAVRYFGPDESYADKVIRVQAFHSPDFGDMPVAAGYVAYTNDIAATGAVAKANCSVIGVPAGTYYLLAFIDSNGNGVRDAWESAGWFSKAYGGASGSFDPVAVTVGPDSGLSDTATIYIEDADTDTDGLPDSWEYATYGSLEAKNEELLDDTLAGEFLVNNGLLPEDGLELRSNAREGAEGLAVHVRSVMRNAGTLALAAGADTTGYDTFADAITGFVSEKLAEDGVKITSLELVDGNVVIKVEAETEPGASSPLLSSGTSHGPTVVAKVYWKQALDDDWQLVKTSDPFVAGGDAVTVEMPKAGDGASGFYQVVVEPTSTR